MGKTAVRDFLADRTLLALRVSSRELSGLIRRPFPIPRHTAGLAFFADGTLAYLEPGREVSGKYDLVLVKDAEFPVRLSFPDLRTSDGQTISAAAEVHLAPAAGREDHLRDFCRTLFRFPGTFSATDLRDHVEPEARRILSEFAAARPAAEMHRADLADTLGTALLRGLERFLFDAGIRVGRLSGLEMVCAEHERHSRDERRRREEDLRSARVMDRKEERLRRLAAILRDGSLRDLLARIPDGKLKAVFYARLMEDDHVRVTAGDLVSTAQDCGEDGVRVIARAMENLLQGGASVEPEEVETSLAGRLYAAAGSRVIEIDPSGAEPPRAYDFRIPLRSVRRAETPRGALLLGGARDRVAAILPGRDSEILEFPFPGGRSVRGGINAIAASGGSIFATHSEYGLARWSAERPGAPGDLLYPEITGPHRTTRAVQAVDGKILFASGPHLYLAPADGGEEPLKFVSSVESPVTCATAAPRTVFAGTESGSIVCWKIDAPDQPVVLARRRGPILNLRLARIGAIPHLVYSSRDLSVRARVIGQNLETSYETGGPQVGALDAASDVICASDCGGRRVLVWKSTHPSGPSGEIDVWKEAGKPLLDLWMSKVPPGGAAHG
jgi:hypothetical protein